MKTTEIHLHHWYFTKESAFYWIADILPAYTPNGLRVKYLVMHFATPKQFTVYPFEEMEYLDILVDECVRDVTGDMMCEIAGIELHALDYIKI